MAILIYTEILLSKKVTRRICNRSNSRAAVAALAKPPPNKLWYERDASASKTK
jgi:hypothetical protein